MNQNNKFKELLSTYKMIFVLIGLVIVCSIVSEYFFTTTNIINIAKQASIVGILSIGMTFAILTGGIDLSVGPNMAMITVIVALFAEWNGILVAIIALAVGFVVGIINGALTAYLKIPAFIVTLGTMNVLEGVALTICKGSPIPGSPEMLQWIGRGKIGGVFPVQIIIFVVVAIIASIILNKTSLGRYTYALGGNPEAARLSGINVKKFTTIIFGISGLLCGVAGLMMVTQLDMGKSSLGDGYEMDAIAAAVIGGTSLKGGIGTVSGTVIGILIISILGNLLNLTNVPSYTQLIIKGAIVVIAAALQTERKKNAKKKKAA